MNYLSTVRHATVTEIRRALGYPDMYKKDVLDRLVSAGAIVELDGRSVGCRKGLRYAAIDSPVVR